MGDEFPGGLGQIWDGILPSRQDHLTVYPQGWGPPPVTGGHWPGPVSAGPPSSPCQFSADSGPRRGGCEKLQVWLVWVTGREQSPQGADEGSPPSGAPMRDAGKPSSEQLELWAAVLVDEAALWVRRAWPQDPGPYPASTL